MSEMIQGIMVSNLAINYATCIFTGRATFTNCPEGKDKNFKLQVAIILIDFDGPNTKYIVGMYDDETTYLEKAKECIAKGEIA